MSIADGVGGVGPTCTAGTLLAALAVGTIVCVSAREPPIVGILLAVVQCGIMTWVRFELIALVGVLDAVKPCGTVASVHETLPAL